MYDSITDIDQVFSRLAALFKTICMFCIGDMHAACKKAYKNVSHCKHLDSHANFSVWFEENGWVNHIKGMSKINSFRIYKDENNVVMMQPKKNSTCHDTDDDGNDILLPAIPVFKFKKDQPKPTNKFVGMPVFQTKALLLAKIANLDKCARSSEQRIRNHLNDPEPALIGLKKAYTSATRIQTFPFDLDTSIYTAPRVNHDLTDITPVPTKGECFN